MHARIPGSKSITNRALVLAAASSGQSRLIDPLRSDDTQACVDALKTLGYIVEVEEAAILVTGTGTGPRTASAAVDCRDAGTVARFVPPLAATGQGVFDFDGTDQLRARPLGSLLVALKQLGARFIPDHDSTTLPFSLHADGLNGGTISLSSDTSSQFVSGVLLAAPLCRGELRINAPRGVSWPYVDMTVAMMRQFGADVDCLPGAFVVRPAAYRPRKFAVEPDASSASYFFAAAAASPGTEVTVPGLGRNALQGDLRFVDVLRKLGAAVTQDDDRTTVTGGSKLHGGLTVDMAEISDTVMTLAAIAPLASGPITITGVGHTRFKESDRLAVTAENLVRLGVAVTEGPESLTVNPGPTRRGIVKCYRDHRIAMAFSVLGLFRPGITLDDPTCVSKTFPGFHSELARCFWPALS